MKISKNSIASPFAGPTEPQTQDSTTSTSAAKETGIAARPSPSERSLAASERGNLRVEGETARMKLLSITPSNAKVINKAVLSMGKKVAASLPEMVAQSKNNAQDLAGKVMDACISEVQNPINGVLGSMVDQDIEAVAFLVLMEASKSAREDLKAIMAEVKNINKAKQEQRENLSQTQARATGYALKTKDDDD